MLQIDKVSMSEFELPILYSYPIIFVFMFGLKYGKRSHPNSSFPSRDRNALHMNAVDLVDQMGVSIIQSSKIRWRREP